MKAQERHQLKQNEFARTAARVAGTVAANRDRVIVITLIAVAVVAVVGGYFWWRRSTNQRASAELAIGLSISQAPITPPSTLPTATTRATTYESAAARSEAALKQFDRTAADYPSTDAGLAARYHAGLELVSLGRMADAERAFQDVIDRGGSSIYATSARLGLAETLAAQGKHDEAIRRFTDLAADRDGSLPIDGVLMQLARTSEKAGKKDDARAAYRRVVDEFPDSAYAQEARQQLTTLN
jgi:TolA-binding protein